MTNRSNTGDADKLLDLIERRFGVRLEDGPVEHLRAVREHYLGKREVILLQRGEAAALKDADYAKAVMISEAAKLMVLREIAPRPRKKRKQKKT